MIFWGSGGASLRVAGQGGMLLCPVCENERPFNLLVNYRWAHLYFLRWVTSKQYLLACDVCHRGRELDAQAVEAKIGGNPIPFMTRRGWIFLPCGVAFIFLMATVTQLDSDARNPAPMETQRAATLPPESAAASSVRAGGQRIMIRSADGTPVLQPGMEAQRAATLPAEPAAASSVRAGGRRIMVRSADGKPVLQP